MSHEVTRLSRLEGTPEARNERQLLKEHPGVLRSWRRSGISSHYLRRLIRQTPESSDVKYCNLIGSDTSVSISPVFIFIIPSWCHDKVQEHLGST